ncbi:hypothetical protein G647_02520 [Cladophialophora carrionii CBS 160.54]|uniref:Uncharacterized protein n=1 Tax=Cladophialophora carrionii CBS 160.54 TaxID=1279043 RepID=V9DGC9_9EURO|nr:uncharacterized protein G647_02520 [Cladophialophora carrionii CBS 160.54]ETI25746.1 hypothetical protein G647_02520 [Cladophialophora carrionii CBS 160.54]
MPIGTSSRSKKPASAHLASSATQFVAPQPKTTNQAAVVIPADQSNDSDAPPTYDEATTEEPGIPTKQVAPTSEHDLQYFAAIAAGTSPQIRPSAPRLVLHLFRTTQTHIFPIEERLALGANSSRPFYALRASLGSTSVDEYNKLTITRRWPGTDVWRTVVISDITPRLKLLAQGQVMISRLRIEQRRAGTNGPADSYELWWDSQTGSYTVWRNKVSTELEICCEGWTSLDDVPRSGHLLVKDRSAVRNESNNVLAMIDFNLPSPQLICVVPAGHVKLDLIVASLLTAATIHTRRAKMMSQTLVSHGMAELSGNSIVVQQQVNANIRVVI